MNELFQVAPDVASALAEGRPVVALESSIIAQGLPHPDNLTVAAAMHRAVRERAAVPAMTAVVDGRIRVGLDEDGIARLVHPDCWKCGARDLGPAVAAGVVGATTVSAALRISAALGIRIFATGGIGGLHRADRAPGVLGRLDISADLMELARAPVAVVSSGAKSLLDLANTLEILEALGVPVFGYRCLEFPAFYTAKSGLPVMRRFDEPQVLAGALAAHWSLPGAGGALICNPPPAHEAMPADEVEALVVAALKAADAAEVSGGALTPFVLSHMATASAGRTLAVNSALAIANADLGGEIADALPDSAE
ncbi:MAG: pseudouridine-5'-phosphate glycosidase [Alphaproteobacteria bacterium]|nr:pseudouridine-5'-phosphate glycosidase [Alphaproteobacteria bacterium]MDP6811763.1 pseudouridine-5'-phosphate glycosidase [Alphaproteobacteria bacterium]